MPGSAARAVKWSKRLSLANVTERRPGRTALRWLINEPEKGRRRPEMAGAVQDCCLLPRRERMLVATAISTPTPKISVPMTLTCGGRPTRVAPQIHSGNVTVLPAVKLVTTKSSMDSANASRMPENTAGRMIGKVTFQNVVHGVAPRSAAASSIERSRVTTRARTMAATNEIENMMCAITIVVKPGPTLSDTNSESSDAPMISSGEEMVLNMITFSVPEPRKRKRPSAYPMPVPSAADTTLEMTAMISDVQSAWLRSSIAKRVAGCHHLSVKPSQRTLYRPAGLLKLNRTITAIGMISQMMTIQV